MVNEMGVGLHSVLAEDEIKASAKVIKGVVGGDVNCFRIPNASVDLQDFPLYRG